MPKKKKKEENTDEAIIQRAVDCLSDYQDRNGDNIMRAEEAIRFRALEQWPDDIRRDRENEHQSGGRRPCPVLDKTNQYVRQIVNEERQNRAAIKIRPVDDDADTKVAEIFTGLIRHIEDASEAIEAYTLAGEQAIDGGYGYFRIIADYCDPMSVDQQDIRIKRIPNRFSVALGPHTEPDGADVKQAVVWEDMVEEDFKTEFPNAEPVSFEASDDNEWIGEDMIRIAEYMEIKQESMTIHLMDTGEVFTDEQLKQTEDPETVAAAMEQGIPIPQSIKSRETMIKTVHWYKLTREQILDQKPLVGTYIPIIKVIGNEICMPDGRIRTSGAIESMMDPQRLHNYAHAGFIEHVALAPRAPWVGAEEAIEGYEDQYASANRLPIAVLPYKHLDEQGNVMPAPQRTSPAGIAPGWQQMLQNTEHGIESAIGMYGPSVGAKSQEKSGVALQEQKVQGMVGNYHFPDNLSRSIQQCGRILLEWIPKYYDTERTARILGEDGDNEFVKLNPNQKQAIMPDKDQMGKETGSIYNLSVGKYDVTVSTGPSYTSKRQEAAEFQLEVIKARPEMLEIMGDKLFRNMDAPGSDDIADRLKTLLPPQIQEMEASKEQGPVDPQIRMMQQQIQQAQEEIQQAAQELEQRGQELNTAEQEIKAKAAEVGADQKEIQSGLREIASARKLLLAEAKIKQNELEDQARELSEPNIDEKKLSADLIKHDREMDLKEWEAKVDRTEEGELVDHNSEAINGMATSMAGFMDQLNGIQEQINTPRSLSIEYDDNDELMSVNGRPVVRDGKGNLLGVQ